jgi:hypothetical protein
MQKGSLVVCLAEVHDHKWYRRGDAGQPALGPNKDEISTVSGFGLTGHPTLSEYPESPNGFYIKCFKEIQPPMDVESIIKETVNEEVLC